MVYAPDPRLRTKCKEIQEITEELKEFMDDMLETMYQQQGVGLAAPQVGKLFRIFVMDCEQKEEEPKIGNPLKLVNPVITWRSEALNEYEEGCLSLPDIKHTVTRPAEVEVEYLDENGQQQRLKATGLTATCVQHELDHLNGITLLNHMGAVRRQMSMQKLRKIKLQMQNRPEREL